MPELGIALKFIRAYDPDTDKQPTALDVDMVKRARWRAFLRGAPDYVPEQHDAMIEQLLKRPTDV